MASTLQQFKDLYKQKAAQIASGQGINRIAQSLSDAGQTSFSNRARQATRQTLPSLLGPIGSFRSPQTSPGINRTADVIRQKGVNIQNYAGKISSLDQPVAKRFVGQQFARPLQVIGGTLEDVGNVTKYISAPRQFKQLPLYSKGSLFNPNNPSKLSVGVSLLGLTGNVADAGRLGVRQTSKTPGLMAKGFDFGRNANTRIVTKDANLFGRLDEYIRKNTSRLNTNRKLTPFERKEIMKEIDQLDLQLTRIANKYLTEDQITKATNKATTAYGRLSSLSRELGKEITRAYDTGRIGTGDIRKITLGLIDDTQASKGVGAQVGLHDVTTQAKKSFKPLEFDYPGTQKGFLLSDGSTISTPDHSLVGKIIKNLSGDPDVINRDFMSKTGAVRVYRHADEVGVQIENSISSKQLEGIRKLLLEDGGEIYWDKGAKSGIDGGKIEYNGVEDGMIQLKKVFGKNVTQLPTQASKGVSNLSDLQASGLISGFTGSSRPKVDLSNQTQQLNVQRLKLETPGKEVVRGLESTEPRSVLGNKEIVARSDEVAPRLKVNDINQTKDVAARDLATRRKVVSDTNDYFKMKASGANKTELEAKLLEIAKTAKVSREAGTDIARQLQARNIVADEALNPMQRVFKLLDNAGVDQNKYIKDATGVDWNNANSVVEFYRKHVPPTLAETLDEFRYTNMLSSPSTQIVNAFSGALQTAVVAPIEKTLSGTLDWAKSSITGSEREYFARQGVDYTKGYFKALPDAVDTFKKTFSGGKPITNLDLEGKIPTGTTGIRKLYTTPLRVLEATDQFFRTLVKAGEIESLKTAGITGEKALKEAEKSADYRLFRQKFDPTGELGQGKVLQIFDKWNSSINNLRNAPGGKWIVPFLQTPTNILKQGIEYSPLGLSTIPGSKKPIEQLSKALIGSTVFTSAYALADSGLVTWDVPTNPKDRAEFYAAGLQPYSVKVGDKWVSFSKLGPLSYPFALASAIKFAQSNGVSDSEISKTAQGIGGFLSFFADQSYMQGIGDIIDALRGDEFKRDRAISNIPQQLIPYRSLQGWLARMVDPVYRKSTGDNLGQTVVNSIKSQTPFVSKTLDPYETPSGEPSRRQFPLINAVSPLKISKQLTPYHPASAKGIYGEINKLSTKEEKSQKWQELVEAGRITKKNVKDIQNLVRDDKLKLTESEKDLRGKGVQTGSRARAIKREFDKAKTKEEKSELWKRYVELGIITKDVAKQLKVLP